jgi:membrane associated rhomboid family serine protease
MGGGSFSFSSCPRVFVVFVPVVFQMNADTANMGSSGAIAAVMGVYFMAHPRVRVATLNPLLFPQ